ncbi:SurA N-terminal domain-containing protein [Caenimonas soli]|uniref:SurA N-terminal domain-containing protein n=1 Tax=Caenimonas soli TaxID=2735555 RepID=UPI001553D131|nr:SurA N-terminal domain-containing protein [Caenimonas soli]NPC56636.1 peptidyl-prolyl cis-trans isomerase [Caenimonas soli]
MFDFVRKHTRVMQFLLFLLIFPSFVLFGLEGYNRYNEKGEAVAKVDGVEIMQGEWDATHKQEVERIRQQMPTLDVKLLDSPAARYGTLERMIRDRVVAAAAAKAKLMTSDQRLARELQQNETIASLRGPDGKLDMARYRQLVAAQGMTPEMFEAGVRADVSARQVLAGLGGTTFATPAQAALALNAYFETREVQVARFAPAAHAGNVNPTDAEIEAFYKSNAALFQAPEQANIEYTVLDLDSVKKSITVNEQDLKTYFEQNAARISGKEERRASHILITAAKDASAADRAKAKAKAEELLAAVKKAPDTFAEVAKKNSQDPGSAANGGDLDFFARGAMTKAFEDAAFALGKGEISGVVETEFGYHIIKVTDVKAPKQRSFEEMKPELEAELKKQQAQRKFAESADAFSNGVYEQADSLKPVADRLKLEIKTASNVRRAPAPGVTGPLANSKFLNALFSPDSVEKKRNTEAVEIAPNTLAAGRVVQYAPARTLPLNEVKDRARERLVAARSAELAKKEGTEKLAAWKANPASASLPPAVPVSRQETQKLPAAVVETALRADPAALPALVGVDLGDQGYAVVKVNKVLPRETQPPEVAKQEIQQYGQWWASAENLAYYELLKERFKVQVKVPKPTGTEASQTQ